MDDEQQRRQIEMLMSGRAEPDAADLADLDKWVGDLHERREALLNQGVWKIFRNSELAQLERDIGRAEALRPMLTEKTRAMYSHQADVVRASRGTERSVREWWQESSPPREAQAAVTDGPLPPRMEPERLDHDEIRNMKATQKEAAQAKSLEQEKPREWWDDGTSPDPGRDPEPERDRR
jgi:hypothetical protein